MVIALVPEPVTWPLVTSMVSIVELSDVFLIVILPLSTSTASEKLRTILLSKKHPTTQRLKPLMSPVVKSLVPEQLRSGLTLVII